MQGDPPRYIVRAVGVNSAKELEEWLEKHAPSEAYRLVQIAGLGPVYHVVWEKR